MLGNYTQYKYIVKNKDYQPISPPMSYELACDYAKEVGNGAFVDNYYEFDEFDLKALKIIKNHNHNEN